MDKSLCKSCTAEVFKTHPVRNSQFVKSVTDAPTGGLFYKPQKLQQQSGLQVKAPQIISQPEENIVKEKPAPTRPEKVKIKFGSVIVYVSNSKKISMKENGDSLELRLQK